VEDERDGLLQQNYVLLAAARHARDLLQGAEEAYDALEEQAGKRIAELEGECARLRGGEWSTEGETELSRGQDGGMKQGS
jgi:hypothetical protein